MPQERYEFDDDSLLALLQAGIDPLEALWMLRYGWPTIRRFVTAGRLARIGRLRSGEFVQILCDEIADEHYLVVSGYVLADAQRQAVRRLLWGDLT